MLDVIAYVILIVAFVLIGLDSLEGYRGKRRRRLREQETDDLVVVAGPNDEVYIEFEGAISPAARERIGRQMRDGVGLVFFPPGGRVKAIRRNADATITVDGTGLLKAQLEQMKPEIRAKLVEGLNDVLRAEAARAGRAQA